MIPADARNDIQISTKIMPRLSASALGLKFKDGKEMKVDLKGTPINELVDQVNRHSRLLARQEDLSGN